MVYVEDVAYTAGTNTDANTRVAKITEKGYYFYNGTEWVKNGAGTDDQLWVEDTDAVFGSKFVKLLPTHGKSERNYINNVLISEDGRVRVKFPSESIKDPFEFPDVFSVYGQNAKKNYQTQFGVGAYNALISIHSTNKYGPTLDFRKYRISDTDLSSEIVPLAGDILGTILFNIGKSTVKGASIESSITDIQDINNFSADINFYTIGKGANKPSLAMTIAGNQNIGIGTNSPTEKLEVNGKIKATSINFTGLPVFENDTEAGTKGKLTKGDLYQTSEGVLMIKK